MQHTLRTIAPTKPAAAAPSRLGTADEVSDVQLTRYADLIYSKTGIRVSPQKKTLLSNRLKRRLRSTGVATFEDYYHHLKRLPASDPEWDAFFQEITTHETYLFRDQNQWDWFRKEYLASLVTAARTKNIHKRLHIWSAACSTGDEAFTAACCIAACISDLSQWHIHILGTDIGVGALDEAKAALFGPRAMRLVPEEYRRRFFTKAKDRELWQARPILTDMVRFHQHNLMQPLAEKHFDLVILKNVLIYFNEASKRVVLDNVAASLDPGGLLMTSSAEGVTELLKHFHREKSWLHRKPIPRSHPHHARS